MCLRLLEKIQYFPLIHYISQKQTSHLSKSFTHSGFTFSWGKTFFLQANFIFPRCLEQDSVQGSQSL